MPKKYLFLFVLVLAVNWPASASSGNYQTASARTSPSMVLAPTQTTSRTNAQSAEDYFKIGVAHNEAKRWEEAIKAFQEAIRIKPDYAEAHYKLGVGFFNLERFEEAVKEFQTAIRFKKDYANAYYNLGQSLSRLQRWREAISVYKEGLPYNSNDADVYFSIGLAYDYLEQIPEAASFYKQAIALKPGHARAHLGLGLTYDNSGRHEEAIEENKKAIAAAPDYADAYYNLGVALANLGRWRECLEAYTNALRYYPYHLRFKAYYVRAYANLSFGDGKAAADDARKYFLFKGWSESGSLYMVIVAYLGYKQSKADSDASNILKEKVQQYWPYPIIQYFRHELTAKELLALAKNDTDIVEVKTYVGLDSHLSGRSAEAIEYLKWVKERERKPAYVNEYRLALAELSRIEK